MMRNLECEMKRSGIRAENIMVLLGCSEKTVRNKIKGITKFTYPEAELVRNTFFPGMLMEYLFADEEQPA